MSTHRLLFDLFELGSCLFSMQPMVSVAPLRLEAHLDLCGREELLKNDRGQLVFLLLSKLSFLVQASSCFSS